MYNDVDIH